MSTSYYVIIIEVHLQYKRYLNAARNQYNYLKLLLPKLRLNVFNHRCQT